MKLNNVSFKGSMVVKGTQDQVADICNEIESKARKENPNFDYKSKQNATIKDFDFEILPIGRESGNKDMFALLTTKNEVSTIGKFANNAKRAGIFEMEGGFNAFYQRNLGKYFSKTEIFNAGEIIEAIKQSRFDFANLLLKK